MRHIVSIPDPILYEVAKPIKSIDGYVKEVASEMKKYLLLPQNIGISAPQLGESIRLIGIKRGIKPPVDIIFIVNPVITKLSSQTHRAREGCISIGHGRIPFTVARHKVAKVKGISLDGVEVTYKGHDLFGRAIQHEVDHLNGYLIDRFHR